MTEFKDIMNKLIHSCLPPFLFVMYLINRGKVISEAMFINCDNSMLTYRFYRKPKAILSLFSERLKYIVIINLMPAAVIAFGLPILLFITGGTDQNINYFLLFISIISMSIFFSVHNLVLYYLFQPYNINLENKSIIYNFFNGLTYFICYFMLNSKVPTFYFGIGVTVFCVIYIFVALILVYKLAPKTFKLR